MDTQLYDTFMQVAEAKRLKQDQPELTNEKLDMVVRSLTEQTKAIRELSAKITSQVEVTNLPEPVEHDDTAVVEALARVQHILEQDNDEAEISKLQSILEALQTLPSRMPKDNESVEVRNLEELKVAIDDGNKQLLEALKALKLNPKITVPEPTVTVQPTDTKGIIKAVESVKKAVVDKPTPVANTPTDPLILYAEADIDDTGTLKYYGYTQTNGSWYIKRYDTSTTPKSIRFCFGSGIDTNGSYATALANRVNLTYRIWGT